MATASMVEFQKNRPHFSDEELLKYEGNWVAFSADGKQIVACADTLEELFKVLQAAGEDIHDVVYERIYSEPMVVSIGAQEFQ